MMTRFAATRLMPSEPALVDMRNNRPLCMKMEQQETHHNYILCHMQKCCFKILMLFSCKVAVIILHFVNTAKTSPCVTGVIKLLGPLLPGGGIGRAVQTIVVNVPEPLAFTFTNMRGTKSDLPSAIYVQQKLQKHMYLRQCCLLLVKGT